MKQTSPRALLTGAKRFRLAAILACLVAASAATAQLPAAWELHVCSEANAFPSSSREQGGFSVRIAELLAEDMGAVPVFVWHATGGQRMVDELLLPGECDMMLNVAENAAGLLNTVPYYRSPYVFVYRADSGLTVESLDDEHLQGLRLSTYPNSIPYTALYERGLGGNIVFLPAISTRSGPDRNTPLIEAVVEGDVDVAILYGADVGYAIGQLETELEVVPVMPEIDLSLIQMFRVWTIGVRPGDEELRDRLNEALASRWEDIQAVLAEFEVPLLPQGVPAGSGQARANEIRIGLILPLPTAIATDSQESGEGARVGANVAASMLESEPGLGLSVRVLQANAPTAAAAGRAAARMLADDDVVALVGGIGEGQAESIAGVVASRDALLFNIGSIEDDLRREMCANHVFHIEASASMYVDALTATFTQEPISGFFVVHEDSPSGQRLAERVRAKHPELTVQSAAVMPGQFAFSGILREIERAGLDVVLVLLEPLGQDLFLNQLMQSGIDVSASGLSYSSAQTREYFARLAQSSGGPGTGLRVVLWEGTLPGDDAANLNTRVVNSTGRAPEPSAWAAYAAITVAARAAKATESTKAAEIAAYLVEPSTEFDLLKGIDLSFRPWDHQLRQPLFVVDVNDSGRWSQSVAQQLALAEFVAPIPSPQVGENVIELLDSLGMSESEASCAPAD